MKRKILVALLVFGLSVLGACSGGTQTCTATGLTAGAWYSYYHVDSEGTEYSGNFQAPGSTFQITDVPSSIDCSSLNIELIKTPLIAIESPPVS
jgi:hypothetical protein